MDSYKSLYILPEATSFLHKRMWQLLYIIFKRHKKVHTPLGLGSLVCVCI